MKYKRHKKYFWVVYESETPYKLPVAYCDDIDELCAFFGKEKRHLISNISKHKNRDKKNIYKSYRTFKTDLIYDAKHEKRYSVQKFEEVNGEIIVL